MRAFLGMLCLIAILIALIIYVTYICFTNLTFIVSALVFLVITVIILYRREKVRKAMNVQPRTFDGAESWEKEVNNFLSRRAEDLGTSTYQIKEEIGVSNWGNYYDYSRHHNDVLTLIRMANRLGCEVIIRKETDHNTEKEEYTPELFSAIINRLIEDTYSE